MSARIPSFWLKLVLLAVLVALADLTVFDRRPGAGLGLFCLAAVAALAVANRAILRSGAGRLALLAAALLGALQIERATTLGMVLFAAAFGVAALAPRAARRSDALGWLVRLAVGALKAVVGPFVDYRRLSLARARRRRLAVATVLIGAVLPAVGGAIFFGLFVAANPVLSGWLESFRILPPDFAMIIFSGMVAGAAWAGLRPRGLRVRPRTPKAAPALPGVTAGSVTASLAIFNLVFLIQNGLDIAFLWSGAALPPGVTFAEYAHRGAYPLIATALLAGLFVLVFLKPGSETAGSPLVRALVVAWVGQNLFLVASTALRTIDYVDAYSLTRLRIAALLWMALVAFGLTAICWRLLKGKPASWLINANAAAALAVLAVCSVVDLGSVAAAWNVRHAREVGGRGAELDLCYLRQLNGAALAPLARLERASIPETLRQRVVVVRTELADEMAENQRDWRTWRFRDARRLMSLDATYPRAPQGDYLCDGAPRPLPVVPPAQPLTPPPNPGK